MILHTITHFSILYTDNLIFSNEITSDFKGSHDPKRVMASRHHLLRRGVKLPLAVTD